MKAPLDPPLTRNHRRCLVALRRGPLHRGAVPVVLGGKVAAPVAQLKSLERRGLARRTRTHWELTEAGQELVAE